MKYFFRKERKIFETYQKEFKTERSKKDKEEIAALKQEVFHVCLFVCS